jgi:hypothetical protein
VAEERLLKDKSQQIVLRHTKFRLSVEQQIIELIWSSVL